MFRERPWISAIYDAHSDLNELFVPDYEIKEGDVLTFGNTTMRFTLVPRHTDGSSRSSLTPTTRGDPSAAATTAVSASTPCRRTT